MILNLADVNEQVADWPRTAAVVVLGESARA
jgi:hypothetical protein